MYGTNVKIISFVVTGTQSDRHSGARFHWCRVLEAEYVRKKIFSEIKVYFYFKNSKKSRTNLKLCPLIYEHFQTLGVVL
jgi:hypothetical protein